MTVADYREAARFLAENGIALRTFLLVRPPFLDESEALEWARRSLDEAFLAGTTFAALIPVRDGNGAMETLAREGSWHPPMLSTVESALEYGLALGPGRMRVTVDLWDIDRFVVEAGRRRAGCENGRENLFTEQTDARRATMPVTMLRRRFALLAVSFAVFAGCQSGHFHSGTQSDPIRYAIIARGADDEMSAVAARAAEAAAGRAASGAGLYYRIEREGADRRFSRSTGCRDRACGRVQARRNARRAESWRSRRKSG